MKDSIDQKYEIIDEFNKHEANLDEKAVQSVFPTGIYKRKGGDPTDITEYRESKFTLRRILKLIGIMILMIYLFFYCWNHIDYCVFKLIEFYKHVKHIWVYSQVRKNKVIKIKILFLIFLHF